MTWSWRSGAVALALASTATLLAGCAVAANAAGEPAFTTRVMVKLVRPSEDAIAIGAEATRHAGVPVTYAAATSTSWHAVLLHCTSAAQCDAAVERLRAAAAIYQAVELDGKKTHASP